MNELKETGGARIGMAKATWPFATLTVNQNRLSLNASVIGNLTFKSSDIISVETYKAVPLLGQGIRIHHRVKNYKEKVIFWTFKSPQELIKKIEQTGFLNNTAPISTEEEQEIAKQQSVGGFPIKTWFAIAVVLVWNLLFLYDFQNRGEGDMPIGNGSKYALAFVFGTGLLLLISEPFRRLVLKDGRTLNDIKKFVLFLMFITGIMLLQSLLMF
ncbi:MAG: hypothetical protein ABJF11_13485 [Reichenbachiella sp.]|uniref:hypothetical protein n=1 Tax=Reichenbachiella sp. TaxID=2184521 RepID=UPI00326362D5